MAKKILIVEDDKPLRDMYQMRLEMEKYQIVTADNGEEGLEKIKSEKLDLILLDLMMPKVSGFEVLQIIKSDEKLRKIPVIVLTAITQNSTKNKGFSYGAEDYLIKSESSLEDVVERVKKNLQ